MDFSIKTSIGISSFVLLLNSVASASEVLYAPAFCEPTSLSLHVTNKSSEPQRLWTQVHFDEEMREEAYDVAPGAQIKIAGSSFLSDRTGFSVKSWERNSLQISSVCDNSTSITLSDYTSPHISHWLTSSAKTVKIHILNLYLKANTVKLQAFNKAGTLIEEKQVLLNKYYDTESVKWSLPSSTTRIDIQGEERLHSWVLWEENGLEKRAPAFVVKPTPLTVDPAKTFFLVSTKEARPEESFVIALSDAQQIATARQQIKDKTLEKIIVGGIELGHGGFNRAFSSRDKSPYSWSVQRVDAFADFAHIDCDGSPDLTEERLMQKLNEGGRICFWRYRVVRELTPAEVSSGKLNTP